MENECTEMDALLKGADKLSPATSKRKQRTRTPQISSWQYETSSILQPFDAAVYACLTTTFYAAARVGESTSMPPSTLNPP